MNKQSMVWWVAAAVAAIFLLALSPIGNHSLFFQTDIVAFVSAMGLVLVTAVAAMVTIYWVRRSK